ncbi:MAG TPA: hypothetical protein VJT50_16405 [Pyrinomonadaceae bacterium]|nr:hypothetical protein [Pyrinomonadaceae bacterium]
MRKLLILSTVLCLIVLTIGSAAVRRNNSAHSILQEGGTRCTRLLYPKKSKKAEPAVVGARCTRLTDKKGKPGKVLPNMPPTVQLNASPAALIIGCQSGAAPDACKPSASNSVALSGIASDRDGDSLLYTFSTTGGRVTGDGPSVIWDLSGVQRGTYTASVEVDDGCGCIAFNSTSVTVSECDGCN